MKIFQPKPIFPAIILFFLTFQVQAQNAWINEFHYDNASTDEGEFVEVVIEDVSSYDLSLFTINLYNGNGGDSYESHSLATFTEGITENGFTFYSKDISGIQNGPDGIALDYNGTLVRFISYGGSFNGVGGSADGVVSEDVGFEETGSTPVGYSIQLTGSGVAYRDFTWLAPATETKGQPNNDQTFGTACTSPAIQAIFSTPSAAEIDEFQITLNWTSGDGDGVVILAKENEPVNEIPQNGSTYVSDTDFSSGLADEIGNGNFVVYDGADTTIDITGLTQGTEYHFAIFEYLSTDQCYLTESETLTITTTTSFDEDSEITAPLTQIPSNDISSVANSEADAVEVFKFEISDLGSGDGQPTLLNTIVIDKSTLNTVSDWSSTIKSAKLNDGTSDIPFTNISINPNNIEFDLTGNEYSIADGNTESLTLSIWLSETQADGDTIGFEIPANHSFSADVSGSLLSNPISSSITSNIFPIDVIATDFEINTVASAQVNEAFNLSARAVDANGNIDLATREISLSLSTGSGNLRSLSVGLGPLAVNNGFYEWTDLAYDTEESIIIEVSDGNGLTVNTPEIDIIPLITTVFISEYIEGSSDNKAIEIYNNSGQVIDLNDFSLGIYTNGSSTMSTELILSDLQNQLNAEEVLIISNSAADTAINDITNYTSAIANFNGDDALALLYKGNIIDVIGEIGTDQGTAWDVAGISEGTHDKTLVRKASVTEGNPNNLASFGTNAFDSEWIVYDTDDFSFLGNHFRCIAPTEQVSNIIAQNITENTAEINWSAPAGTHSIVLLKEGSTVDFPPISGNSYSANPDFTLANELGDGNKIAFAGSGENINISNLNAGTIYHVSIFAYDETENCYNLASPATASFSTEMAFNTDTEINKLTQPEVSTLLSTTDEELEAEDIFAFQVADLATNDTVPTLIKEMVFQSASSNTLPWENTINAILKDENGKINNAEINVLNDSIKIDFHENEEYEIPSGESVNFSLAIWFNRFEVTDTQQFALQIPAEHEFVSFESGSGISNILAESIISNQIEIVEAFDRIEDVRNGNNSINYITTGYVSSNDFGSGNSQFYIQNEESTTYEQGIAVYSDVPNPNINFGNKVRILGSREEVNGTIRINTDTVIVLSDEISPETYLISPADFNNTAELIGTRVQLDSMILNQPESWRDIITDALLFTKLEDSVFVKIEPNTIYFDGAAQVPFGAVDLKGVMEKRNDSIQLIVTLDNEITDSYAPIFTEEPQISNIQSEAAELNFSVNELSTVYYALKNDGDSIPDLEVLKNPESDAQIISFGEENIVIGNIGNSISSNIKNLSSNTEYSVFIVAEDTLGNANEIKQLDFFTLNAAADEDVEVIEATEQISATAINAFNATQEFIPVFNFTIKDGGTSDELSAFINQIVVQSAPENEVDFVDVISEVELHDLTNDTIINSQKSVFPDSIVFELDEIFEVNDGDSNTFQLKTKLNQAVEDELNLAFEIPSIESGWQVEPNGSQLAESFSESVISSVHSLDVVATDLNFSYPSEVYIEEDFDILLSTEDANGNLDKAERTMTITTSAEGELSGQTELNIINGTGEFEGLSFNQTGASTFEITDGSVLDSIEINFIQAEISLDSTGFNNDFGLITFPDSSTIESYRISAAHLKDSLLLIAPEAFQLSLNPDFSNGGDTLVLENQNFSTTEIFVRFSPEDSNGDFYNGNILHLSQDADSVLLPVSGQEGTLSLSTIASARDKLIGERVKIQGIVIGGNNHFEEKRIVQDETGGIAIQGMNSSNINFGDSVEVEGILEMHEDWLTLISEKIINILSSDSSAMEPMVKSISEINDSLEFQRVRIENLDIFGSGQFEVGNYLLLDDNTDSLIFRLNGENHPLIGVEIPIGKVNISGFIGERNGVYQLYPEFVEDLEIIPRDTVLTILAPEDGLSFGNVMLDEFSEPQSYSLKAENLPENLKISASENFQISLLEFSNYSNDLELPINEIGNIPEINVYVRFSPVEARRGEIEGELVHISGDQEYNMDLKGFEEMITSNKPSNENQFLIYPNPVDAELKIEVMIPGDYRYQLIGLEGVILYQGKISNDKVLKLNGLESGIYHLKITHGAENHVQRIIKK
ncbi:lamin tail domain-containing protein [Marivirga sp.]|uniref:lamin tail domain-containing protein n=1 Tax=Marivirga sp. TaxID=2018662 RepID=UPI002D7E5067|nr:lamin tail domain-containing protein [Marivirga sp.]HET8861322.1 lamin tail domain-containing protein [Marivirga sp.]